MKKQSTYLGLVLVALIVWWIFFHDGPAPKADVELGEPTVTGSGSSELGGTDYLTKDAAMSDDTVN